MLGPSQTPVLSYVYQTFLAFLENKADFIVQNYNLFHIFILSNKISKLKFLKIFAGVKRYKSKLVF